MSTNWAHYEPYHPPHRGPLSELSRAQAEQCFNSWIEARAERWHQLHLLVKDDVPLDDSCMDVSALDRWFRATMESSESGADRLSNRCYAVVNDVARVLGDCLICRCPNLKWEFFTQGGPSDVAYQKPVIVGFRNVANPNFNLDIDRLVATYAHQLIAGVSVPDGYFRRILESAEARA